MLQLTNQLQEIVQSIISADNSNSFQMDVSLRNYDDETFVITDLTLNTIVINSQFSTATADDIQSNITVNFQQLLQIGKKLTSSYLSIVLEYLDDTGEVDLEVEPSVYEFRIFFHDFENIAKRYNISNLVNLDPMDDTIIEHGEKFTSIDLRIQLIADPVYRISKKSLQVVSSRTSMDTLVKYIATKLGVVRTKITQPDNTTIFGRINVPVDQTRYDTIFDYLQHRFGIYSDGLAYYYTNEGTFFMYPRFDVDPDREDTLRIVKVNPNNFAGLENKWSKEGDVLSVVCDSDIKHLPSAPKLVENVGSIKIFASADKIIDGQVNVKGDGSVDMNDVHYALSSNVNQTVANQAVIPQFKTDTINQYQMLSELSEANSELVVVTWDFSRLFAIKPGMRVEFVYDEEDQTMMLSGVVETVTTEVLRGSRQNSEYKYTASSILVLRLTTEAVLYRIE